MNAPRPVAGADAQSNERSAQRPVLFLDLDDVVCLNAPYGGYDVALARATSIAKGGATRASPAEIWEQLFDIKAREYLRRLHDEFCPQYVLSTSWWWLLDDDALREVLVRGGLRFVFDNLHPDSATPKGSKPGIRWAEISNWLAAHPECSDRWVVLDDKLSGTGLTGQPRMRAPFIVLCSENVGLTEPEYERLRAAFQLRSDCRTARSSICDDAK